MKISQLYNGPRATLSFEVFPPKTDEKYESVRASALQIARLRPDFMSVTCGAGGNTDIYTRHIARDIHAQTGVTAMAHLTCVAAKRDTIDAHLADLERDGIENVLALRGDLPEGVRGEDLDFTHASDLIDYIRSRSGLCIGAACYPEKHPESDTLDEDIRHIRTKQDAGCSFLTTQMFFDNELFFKYLWRLHSAGVTIPVTAGIMPVTNARQLDRIRTLSGSVMPPKFLSMVDRFGKDPAAMTQAGIIYATE